MAMELPKQKVEGGLRNSLMYALARVEIDGCIYVNTPGRDYYDPEMGDSYINERVVHLESEDIPTWGLFYAQKLATVKEHWNPRSNQIILGLDHNGAVERLWVGTFQKALINERLDIWRRCYGNWPIKSLG